jgi:hypothetical protein
MKFSGEIIQKLATSREALALPPGNPNQTGQAVDVVEAVMKHSGKET